MPEELRIAGAAVLALAVTSLLAPLAMRIAWRTGCLDRPRGYRAHKAPTPYLGGVALIGGFAISVVLFAGIERFWPLLVGAIALAALGILDDRIGVPPRYRVMAEVAAAGLVTAGGLGWTFPPSEFEAFLLNAAWIVGFTNAFNLLDNLDGAAGTVGAVSAAGAGILAASKGDPVLAAFGFSLAGACAGFLPHNLARPSRIFLGDGGSTPVGFLLAAIVLMCPGNDIGWPGVLASAPLVGVAIFDTTLVVVSRLRRGARVLSGGRDHVTHRLFTKLGSERAVCVALAGVQALLIAAGFALFNVSVEIVFVASLIYMIIGAVVLALLEGVSVWTPQEESPT